MSQALFKSSQKTRGSTYVGSFGQDYMHTSREAKYLDDDFNMGDTGFVFYDKPNIEYLQIQFQEIMVKDYGYNVGRQKEEYIIDQMHEAFWEIHEIMFQRKKARTNANLQKSSVRGWQFDPNDNEKRGIPKVRPEYDRHVDYSADTHSEELTLKELIELLNRKTLDNMIRIAREKIATYENYQKMYNKPVEEILYYSNFGHRPQGEGTDRGKRLPTRNPFRFKPRTYEVDTFRDDKNSWIKKGIF